MRLSDRDVDWVSDDVLESAPGRVGRLGEWWSTRSRRQRWAVVGPLAAVVAIAAVELGAAETRSWLAERTLADELDLSLSLGVSSSSTTPMGGRVDFFVTIRNAGARPVSITSVDITAPRLRITNTAFRISEVTPDGTLGIPLSVILDCTEPTDGVPVGMRGVIDAVPASGNDRRVDVAVAEPGVVTDIADTLCKIKPDVRGLELDGPVLQRL